MLKNKFLKVIAGINNFDKDRVLAIVQAANQMKADFVDIAADDSIIAEATMLATQTKICVSSVQVSELVRASRFEVAMLELGNYEALHAEGVYPSAEEVLAWTQDLLNSLETRPLISVTIPGHLSVLEQVALAEKLEELGVDLVQTEGASLVEATSPSALGQIEKVRLTLANTMELSKNLTKTRIMTASAMTPDTVKLAIAAGASGVGVGAYINKLSSSIEMMAAIRALQEALGINQEKNEAVSNSQTLLAS